MNTELNAYFSGLRSDDTFLQLSQLQVSGGKKSIEAIDTIKQLPHKNKIMISGLTQDSLNYFIDNYGHQFEAIYIFQCPRIEDLSCLEQLENVKYLLIYWNQKATRLWDLSKNRQLKGLLLNDFTKLHTLDDVANSTTLEILEFGNAIHVAFELESFKPLRNMSQLKTLSFSIKKFHDPDLTPLTHLTSLRHLEFPANLLTVEEITYLKTHLPKVQSRCFQAFQMIDPPIGDKDCMIIGKRNPFLNAKKDAKRLARYIQQFNKLEAYFLENLMHTPKSSSRTR